MSRDYFYYVIVKKTFVDHVISGLCAVAVRVEGGTELKDALQAHLRAGETLEHVFPVATYQKAKEVADCWNQSYVENGSQRKSEDWWKLNKEDNFNMDTETKEVYQELVYDRQDPEQDNYRIARMDKEKRDTIEKATDDIVARLQEYHDLMRRMLGDGAYTESILQVQHHLGQIKGDLFDPLAGLM